MKFRSGRVNNDITIDILLCIFFSVFERKKKFAPRNATKIEKEVRMTKAKNIQPKLDLAAVEAFATEELTHFLTGGGEIKFAGEFKR